MRKKLILSFASTLLISIFVFQPAFAAGQVLNTPSFSFKTTGETITVCRVSDIDEPSGAFKLQRMDLPEISGNEESLIDAASEDNIIYSPDLPEPFSDKELCEDPNYYLALELEMINMVNKARVEAGESELVYSEELSYFARTHSEDMSQNHYFSHTSPTNGSYVKRLYASGINYISSGENLARFSCLEDAHAALLASFGHKQNMLSSKYTHIGIGITWDEKLEVYCITQWFARFY